MATEIGVIFKRPNDRVWLPRLRQWIEANGPPLDQANTKTKARVNELDSPLSALSWRAEMPEERLVVTIGFSKTEIEENQ